VTIGGMMQKEEGCASSRRRVQRSADPAHSAPTASHPTPFYIPTPRQPFERWVDSGVRSYLGFVWHIMRAIGTVIVLMLLALFVVALWREPLERVRHTVTSAPAMSWVVGVLTALAFAVVVPALAVLSAILVIACGIGLLGIGIIAIAGLALVIGWLIGWIVIGQLVGERVLGALDHAIQRRLPRRPWARPSSRCCGWG